MLVGCYDEDQRASSSDERFTAVALMVAEGTRRRLGERLLEMRTVPENPPMLVRLIVELSCEPRFNSTFSR